MGWEQRLRPALCAASRQIPSALSRKTGALAEVKGISEKMARRFQSRWKPKRDASGHDVFAGLRHFHESGLENLQRIWYPHVRIIKENPYRLADDIQGVGFKMADEIARRSAFSQIRISASAAAFIIRSTVRDKRTHLSATGGAAGSSSELLHVDPSVMEKHLTDLQIEKKIVVKVMRRNLRKQCESR